jgi:ribosomal protein S27E/DNA-binding CsgD family transcriptional regulator
MGRLTNAKIDQIAKMRKEGYTQQEAAEKTGVHIRTVRKYDVTRTRNGIDNKSAIKNALQAIRILMDWLRVLIYPLLSEDNLSCPSCLSEAMAFDDEAETFLCHQCGYRMALPDDFCEHCLSLNTVVFDRELKSRICQKCGARQSS